MASNAVIGTLLHFFVLQDMQPEALNFWLVCIPVVMLGAPFGTFVVSKVPRLAIAYLLYTIIIVQFVAAVLTIGRIPISGWLLLPLSSPESCFMLTQTGLPAIEETIKTES